MKYWRGYLVAAIVAAFTWALTSFAKAHTMLIDMLWPYITRTYQTLLADWSGGVSFCIWQMLFIFLILLVLASVVLMIILKWNPIQWLGWVLAVASLLFFFHTTVYGLNAHAGSIADDIHLTETEYTLAQLEEAAAYYRDKANDLASQVKRDSKGNVDFDSFEKLAARAHDGYDVLVYEHSCSIFAGSDAPVKKLAWADMYTSMGITGVTMGMTGEAGVNPQIPATTLPFTMCHELAHRVSIATERDANFAAFLACRFNPDIQFQYSAYFMAYRYCVEALATSGTEEGAAAAARIRTEVSTYLYYDLRVYDKFFSNNLDQDAVEFAESLNTRLSIVSQEQGSYSDGQEAALLTNWYVQEFVLPYLDQEDITGFDPMDESQVDISDLRKQGR